MQHLLMSLVEDDVGAWGSDADGVAAVASRRARGSALLPCNVELLSEGNGSIIVGELSSSGAVGGSEGDAVVHIEDTVGAAWRPDGSGGFNTVEKLVVYSYGWKSKTGPITLRIDLPVNELAATSEGRASGLLIRSVSWVNIDRIMRTHGLASILREVVGSDKATSDTGVKTSPAVVGSINNSVLEAAGVLEVQVELAVLALVGGLGAGADVGLEGIETISDDLEIL